MDLTFAAIVVLSVWVIAIVAAGLVLTLRPGGAGLRFGLAKAAAPATGERLEILLGGKAEVLGNPRGRVQGVLVQPDNRRLLGVEMGGGVIESEAVPAAAIVDADGQVLSLADQWDEPDADTAAGAATFRANAAVVGADRKRLGRLRLVCFDQATGTVTALVMATSRTLSDRLVPMARVIEASPARVATDLRADDIEALHVFETDWNLKQQIQEAFSTSDLLRSLRIAVRDQRVRVQGYVADRSQAERVASILRAIPGILQLDLLLLTDAELAQRILDAISRDQQTASARVQVTARTGVIDIVGEAPDRSTARRIETVARQVDGVEVVHNMVAAV